MKISAAISDRPLNRPFAISRGVRTCQPVLEVSVTRADAIGRGTATGVAYRGETAAGMRDQVLGLADAALRGALDRFTLQELLPAGGARAALDAALWELEAVAADRTVASLCGIAEPLEALESAFTIVLDTPDAMAEQARAEAHRPLLKVKLGGDAEREVARIRAVRDAAPDARLVADANAGWTPANWQGFADALASADYQLLEQPLPVGEEHHLDAAASPLPLCADESLQTRDDLERLEGTCHVINIKLDKCGGLTHALALKEEARARGFGIFVGCMLAPARAIAPAFLLAQDADYVDLDGPFWFADDEDSAVLDPAFRMLPITSEIWIGHRS